VSASKLIFLGANVGAEVVGVGSGVGALDVAEQATVESAEYVPALQGVQEIAPVNVSVSVTLSTGQIVHEVDPALLAYLPAAQGVAVVAALFIAVPPLLEAYEPAGTCVEQDTAEVEEE